MGEGEARFWPYGGGVYSPFDGDWDLPRGAAVAVVLLCRDALQRYFRFAYWRPAGIPDDDRSLSGLDADISEITENHPIHDAWAREPLVWE